MHKEPLSEVTIDNVRTGKHRPSSRKTLAKSPAGASSPLPSTTAKVPKGKNQTSSCGWCGRERHSKNACPAKDATCRQCSKKGHFATVCRSAPAVRSVQEQEPGFLGLTSHGGSSNWDVTVVVNNKEVVFKADTGADETVLPEGLFRHLFEGVQLQPAKRPLDGPNGKDLTAADTLSRSPVQRPGTTKLAEEIQGFVDHVTSS
ncbi:unnamed protein product, partial [Ixodes pacificus]